MALGHKSKSVSHMTLLGSHQGIEKGELIKLVCREFSFLLAHGHLGTWSPGHLACLVCLAPGHLAPGHLGTWCAWHLGTWAPGHLAPGHLVCLAHGHLGTWAPGHLGTWCAWCAWHLAPGPSC